jgi:hypothetical protein
VSRRDLTRRSQRRIVLPPKGLRSDRERELMILLEFRVTGGFERYTESRADAVIAFLACEIRRSSGCFLHGFGF